MAMLLGGVQPLLSQIAGEVVKLGYAILIVGFVIGIMGVGIEIAY